MRKSTFTGSSAHLPRSKPLKAAAEFTKVLLKNPRVRPRVKSIAVFGSALRQRDFVGELSDVDVLVLVDRKSERLADWVWRATSLIDHHISPVVFSAREFIRMLKAGYPGALLMLQGAALYDTGVFSAAKGTGFEPTKKTIRTLNNHAFCALSIALNDYFSGLNLPESVNCAYHCVRHASRAVIIKETGILAGSNKQITQLLSKYPWLHGTFGEFVEARRNVKKLIKTYDSRRAHDPGTTLQNGIGKFLLRAERAVIKSCGICAGKKPHSFRALLRAARQKYGKCEIVSISWGSPGWKLVVKHRDEIKPMKRLV